MKISCYKTKVVLLKLTKIITLLIFTFSQANAYALFNINVHKTRSSQNNLAYYNYPLLPKAKDKKFYRQAANLGQVYQWDNTPIGNRNPLLLIHGGSGEGKYAFRWDRFINHTNADFNRHYKIYLYRYNSKARIRDLTPRLQQSLRRLYRRYGNKTIAVMCLSMGGNLIQAALTDSIVAALVDVVLSMGSPFHGSPLFSSDWFQYSLNDTPLCPPAKTLNAIGYKIYFKDHPNYLQDLKWDNMDSLIPDVGKFKAKVPLGPKGDLRVVSEANQTLKAINVESLVCKDKFITYAGYISNSYLRAKGIRIIENIITWPYHILMVRIPLLFGNTNSALKYLNSEMANVKVNNQASYINGIKQSYALNDGITPVSSAIYISNDGLKNCPLINEKALLKLNPYIDVRIARVFKNVGHVSFLEGNPIHGNKFVLDCLHKNQGHHTLFKWMQIDLMTNIKYYFSNAEIESEAEVINL